MDKLMKAKDKAAWMEKNARVNASTTLALGMRVVDSDGHNGVVVKIIEADDEFHGTVYVWQSDRNNYGADNCEHYCFNNWHAFLRVLQ